MIQTRDNQVQIKVDLPTVTLEDQSPKRKKSSPRKDHKKKQSKASMNSIDRLERDATSFVDNLLHSVE